MTDKTITIPLREAAYDELDADRRRLVDLARAATRRSYAPYSHFHVGAAIRLSNGEIVTGSNQENVATPLGTCAERTASFYAHSVYPEARMECIAIAARDTSGNEVATPITPCGGCRQVLAEWERLAGKPMEVMLCGADRIVILPSVAALLPLAFTEF